MDDVPVFKCRVCHAVISNPVWSLDRNSQQYSTGEVDGQDLTIITMLVSQEMFRYDSLDCWHVHEPIIAKRAQAKNDLSGLGAYHALQQVWHVGGSVPAAHQLRNHGYEFA